MNVSWKEYSSEYDNITDLLPYGGLIKPNVLRCKDDSFLGVLKYSKYLTEDQADDSAGFTLPAFCRGWSIWTEKQHSHEDNYYIYLSCNPFFSKKGICINQASKTKKTENDQGILCDYFQKELENFCSYCQQFTDAEMLEYDDFLAALNYSLSLDTYRLPHIEMPLYIDWHLSHDLTFSFLENDILVNDRRYVILSLPSFLTSETALMLYKAFQKETYRHTKRILMMNKKEYSHHIQSYMKNWCSGRNSIKKFISADIETGQLHGLAHECFIFLTSEADTLDNYIKELMDILELPYVLESFNLKDVWWGSLPGMFRANLNPPAVSMAELGELLYPME